MVHPVVFRPQAEALEVKRWYESKRDGLGREFGEALSAIVARITSNPFLFPTVYRDTRRAVLSAFPYAVCFRLAESTVVVLSIHGRQDPGRWQDQSTEYESGRS